ncbi:MAG: hypothetical protein IPG00_14480 [Saprospiraceae bacterium]|nr:hypothetical protein [Saprospiraceae bacterium]
MNKKGIILYLTLLLGGTSMSACKCTTFSLNDETERATTIFIGILQEQAENKMIFHLIKLYKGESTSNVEFQIIQSNSSCYKQRKFKVGEMLIVFTEEEGIHNCSRTKNIEFNSDFDDLEKLNPNAKIYDQIKYNLIEQHKSQIQKLLLNCGLDNFSTLNSSEIEFLIQYLNSDKANKDFENVNVLFVTGSGGSQISDKTEYFKSVKSYNLSGKRISNNIIWLDDEMKMKSGGYDVIITFWVKVFSNRRLNKIVKQAKKLKEHTSNK